MRAPLHSSGAASPTGTAWSPMSAGTAESGPGPDIWRDIGHDTMTGAMERLWKSILQHVIDSLIGILMRFGRQESR